MLDELFDLVNQALRFKRLCHHGIASSFIGAIGIEWLECAGQQNHGNGSKFGMRLHELADFVAVFLGHDDVGQDDVRAHFRKFLDGFVAVIDGCDLVIAVGEGQLNDLLNGDAVIRE